MYFLVLIRENSPADDIDHEPFVDSLIERNRILLGGPFGYEPIPGFTAAYVLQCGDQSEAEQIVASDPLVTSGCCESVVVPWELVGVNTAAIDPEMIV